jgi:hypothetical protein
MTMIVPIAEEPLAITELPSTPEERARNLAAAEEFRKNIEWFGERAKEIRDAHTGKFICIVCQELFVGDDPVEVTARAAAAHPSHPGGSFSMRLSTHRGPKIYAN